MPRIRFDGIKKSFGSISVIPELYLELDNGEFTVLVGPSGCGKSTTLRMLAGLETISGGEIWFDDKAVSALEPKDRDIAMVFQDYALYPHMNIARNMSFALRLKRVRRAEIDKKVREVAEMLGIGHLLERKPAELSGGQRQRVAMGRALVRDASTFLFDEPLSNLDAKLRAKMRTELASMRNHLDKNMIYVTHDQIEAMTLGDRIVVMSEGRIQQQGSPEELYKRPANKFVAGFIGSPTMNFLTGELLRENEAVWVRGDGFSLALAPETAARLDRSARDVEIGVRPNAFRSSGAPGSPIRVHVDVSEYLGATSVLVGRLGAREILVELGSDAPIRAQSDLEFQVSPSDIMVFDPSDGRRL